MDMYNRRSRSSILTRTNAKREIVQQTRGIDKPVFLLGGFALENAIWSAALESSYARYSVSSRV
jgi:hypothetical protein